MSSEASAAETYQQRFGGDYRPPSIPEFSIGEIVTMVMCAHRVDSPAGMGWYTGDFDDVVEEWVLENVEATVSQNLGDRARDHSTRREERTQEMMLDDHRSSGPMGKQTTLSELVA